MTAGVADRRTEMFFPTGEGSGQYPREYPAGAAGEPGKECGGPPLEAQLSRLHRLSSETQGTLEGGSQVDPTTQRQPQGVLPFSKRLLHQANHCGLSSKDPGLGQLLPPCGGKRYLRGVGWLDTPPSAEDPLAVMEAPVYAGQEVDAIGTR